MNSIYRNFISIMKANKAAFILYIFSLAIAFTLFTILCNRMDLERNYDRMHSNVSTIYRLECVTSQSRGVMQMRPFTEAFASSSPHILGSTILNPYVGKPHFTVKGSDGDREFKEPVVACTADIVDIFDFHLREGSLSCLNDPGKCLIPASMAGRLFGKESAIGKELIADQDIWSTGRGSLTVGGVYQDFPDNTQLDNTIYTALDPGYDKDSWEDPIYLCYVLLDTPGEKNTVCDQFNRTFPFDQVGNLQGCQTALTNLGDIYYLKDENHLPFIKSGNKQQTDLLLGVSLLVILIAAINFINFSVALVPARIRGIHIRKILGGSVDRFRLILWSEPLLITLISFGLSILLFYGYSCWEGEVFRYEGDIFLIGLSVALLVGLLAGGYPAVYATSVPSSMVLNGSFGLSPKGKRIREILIGFQYVVSMTLVVLSLFVYKQTRYLESRSFGFGKEDIVVVELNQEATLKHKRAIASRLKEYAGIEDVAFSASRIGAANGDRGGAAVLRDSDIYFFYLNVSPNFLSVMGVSAMEGRISDERDANRKELLLVFDRNAKDAFGLHVGDYMKTFWGKDARVLGITDEIRITSAHKASRQMAANPLAFVTNEDSYMPYAYIRLSPHADINKTLEYIRQTLHEFIPSYPVEFEFCDTFTHQLYEQDRLFGERITYSSALAVLISLSGIFGLVLFEAQYRRKEIGIRRVYGSTVHEILYLLNWRYLRLALICFLLSIPLSYYLMEEWAKSFSEKVSVGGMPYILTLTGIAALTVLVVTFQSWKAANENPVDTIR